MNEKKDEIMVDAACHVGDAIDCLYKLLDSNAYTDETICTAINSAISYLSEIAGNMWAIIDEEPEDIEEL